MKIPVSFMYNIICLEMIHMHHVLCYFVHKIWFEEFVYEICIPYLIKGVKFIRYARVCIVRTPL